MVRAIIHPRMLDRIVPIAYPSRATLEGTSQTRTPSGAVANAWSSLAGLTGIPAAVSPMIYTRSGERKSSSGTTAETTHRIALLGAFPQIQADMRLRVTGPNAGVYDVVRPDRDSQGITTVLEAKITTPTAEAGV